MADETGLSTKLASDYRIKNEPKGLSLKVDSWYTLADGYGTKEVKIVSIRKLGDEVLIYYKYQKQDGKLLSTWQHNQTTLNTFKVQLLEYGKIDSIDLLYPGGNPSEQK